MNEAVKTKLYTFDEFKDVVAQAIADMAAASAHNNEDFDDPSKVFLMEMAVGAKLLSELDDRHEKGEI